MVYLFIYFGSGFMRILIVKKGFDDFFWVLLYLFTLKPCHQPFDQV